jgi:predicted amidophosphoribosyltransferase
VTWLGEYHPYRGGSNPRHYEPHSQAIYRFKKYLGAHDYLEELSSTHICTVIEDYGEVDVMFIPSHDPTNRNFQFRYLIKKITREIPDAVAMVNSFRRSRLAPKLTEDNTARRPSTLIDTCEITGERMSDTVVLLDDIVTSGSSMVGGSTLLKLHGYEHVVCVALGRTV